MNERRAVLLVVFGMLCHPFGICSSVVGHPVEPYFHLQLVCAGYESFQVGDGSVGGVHLLEVRGCVGTVYSAAARIDWHEPHHVDAESFELSEALLGCGEGAFCGERADVEFVDHSLPLGADGFVVDLVGVVFGQHGLR